jgi:hypothetical protein
MPSHPRPQEVQFWLTSATTGGWPEVVATIMLLVVLIGRKFAALKAVNAVLATD